MRQMSGVGVIAAILQAVVLFDRGGKRLPSHVSELLLGDVMAVVRMGPQGYAEFPRSPECDYFSLRPRKSKILAAISSL